MIALRETLSNNPDTSLSEQFNLAEKKLAILYRVTESISTKILLCVRSMLPEALRKEKVLQVSCCVELDIFNYCATS